MVLLHFNLLVILLKYNAHISCNPIKGEHGPAHVAQLLFCMLPCSFDRVRIHYLNLTSYCVFISLLEGLSLLLLFIAVNWHAPVHKVFGGRNLSLMLPSSVCLCDGALSTNSRMCLFSFFIFLFQALNHNVNRSPVVQPFLFHQ